MGIALKPVDCDVILSYADATYEILSCADVILSYADCWSLERLSIQTSA